MKRSLVSFALVLVYLWASSLVHGTLTLRDNTEQLSGPGTPDNFDEWYASLLDYRTTALDSINYNGSLFTVDSLVWTTTSYIQTQMHPYDKYFYTRGEGYTIDKFLDDLIDRYGGIDSMLLWPTYPNIGIDNRNQYDLILAMPGHKEGLLDLINSIHLRGVTVLLPYNPWDQGTRDTGQTDDVTLTQLIADVNADGLNGDTMSWVPESFFLDSEALDHPVAIEPELGGILEALNWETMGWGYWSYPYEPMVDRWKWLEPRHLTHVCNRWAQNHLDDLQASYFNGDGFESWENVWGTWNGITPRDGQRILRTGAILRFFGDLGFPQSQGWIPHTPTVIQNTQVYASEFPVGDEILWLLVNRGTTDLTGKQLTVTTDGFHFYDCYAGEELLGNGGALEFPIEAQGFGCVIQTKNITTPGDSSPLGQFLIYMSQITQLPLSSYDDTWQYLCQEMVEILPTNMYTKTPPDMVYIPPSLFHFQVQGVEIEGDDAHGVDFQYPWETHPQRTHNELLHLSPFYIHKFPVTNAQYQEYLSDSHYVPEDPYNFLAFWQNGTYPEGWADKPVAWVSLQEARDFCSYYGYRLPHSYEWQYAAQGTDGRLYPWGNTNDQNNYPVQSNGRTLPGPEDVGAHSPAGDSIFGVADLVGNVWQFTDEFQDSHTRAAVLRGGSNYYPSGSSWYFPQALELNKHNKYLLFDDAYERAGTLSFRCVADADTTCHNTYLCSDVDFAPSSVDLTSSGSCDWEEWSDVSDRKKTPSVSISDLKVVGDTPSLSSECPSNVFWSDGTQLTTGETTECISFSGVGSGFYLSAPADKQSMRKLSIFMSLRDAVINATAGLSDGSGLLSQRLGPYTGDFMWTIQFKSSTSGAIGYVDLELQEPCDSNLCGSLAIPESAVNLTEMGDVDWVHWGLETSTSVDRKIVTGSHPISDFTVLGGVGNVAQYSNNPVSFSWSDGTPHNVITGSTTGVYFSNAKVSLGFRLTVETSTSMRKLSVFVGVWSARGRITVSLSDGSSSYTDNSISNYSSTTNGVYEIYFRGGTGVTLTVDWVQDDGTGNVTLQAATLEDASNGLVSLQAATFVC